MEAAYLFETLLPINQATWRHAPEDALPWEYQFWYIILIFNSFMGKILYTSSSSHLWSGMPSLQFYVKLEVKWLPAHKSY